ncbi:MAG: Rne/Rng family ribonuclease [Bacteroidales bacterium]|nr:Rne/Rng family ribonuclease [Bacteroidales bacterium]
MSETKELIITTQQKDVQIALLEDQKLVELHRETASDQFSVGDIYLGKVHRINTGLNAAFVSIGSEKDAFLHYLDLGPNARTLNNFVAEAVANKRKSVLSYPNAERVEKNGKIGNVLSTGQTILVQIAKEPISTKGPRITTEISFAGRYLVLVPFSEQVAISQKIKSRNERNRLRKIVMGIKPKNFGVIIRTIAKDKQVEELSADLKMLVDKWKLVVEHLTTAVAPELILAEMGQTTALIRDIVNSSFNAIYIDTPSIYQEVKSYIHTFAEDKDDIVKLYKDSQPIFEHFNVAKQIKGAFGKVVTMKNGIYLIIEHTEAMHVIDVNSGNRMKTDNQEENALQVNLEAAAEIARQLRLRDMGGLVVIDFIDMAKAENRKTLHRTMTELMENDRARHTVLPPSKFGLIEITRQRVRQATTIETLEECPTCHGTGKVKPSILLEEDIENTIEFLVQKQNQKHITLTVHPYIYAYLTKGLISKRIQWFFKFKQWIRLESNQEHQFLEYKFYNRLKEEIVLWNSRSLKME